MNIPDRSNNHSHLGLKDGAMLPLSSDNDKLHSILNVLKGHEEYTLSLEGTIISSNLEAVNITGYEEWEVIGKNFSILYSDEDIITKQPESDLNASLIHGKKIFNSWKLKKRQTRFWARIKITPIIDSLTTLRGYKVILRDATHKVFSDLNVRKIKNEYLNLYHNSIFGILRFRQGDGNIKLANKKAMEILGIKDIHDFSFRDAFIDDEEFERFNTVICAQQFVNNFEFQLKHAHGSRRWASIDCKLYGTNGFIEGVLIDVTEKKSQELALQKLNNDLDTFIYHASHDLRSPLSSIIGLLNLMDMTEQTGKVNEYSVMIRDRVGHLDSLLKDLSTIAFNNHSEINYERVFVKEEIKFMLRDPLGSNRVQFFLKITDDTVFISDVLRFRAIMKNLISNGVKYHNQIEKEPYVSITVKSFSDKIAIEVEDNGIGIEKAEMDKIYSMFHRGHSSRSGFGLGLYTVRSMIDQLQGNVEITSTIGVGTKVKIELPNK